MSTASPTISELIAQERRPPCRISATTTRSCSAACWSRSPGSGTHRSRSTSGAVRSSSSTRRCPAPARTTTRGSTASARSSSGTASSYLVGTRFRAKGTTFEESSRLDPDTYAAHGGSFPISVEGAGVIGTVTVSGLPQAEDHAMVVEALEQFAATTGA